MCDRYYNTRALPLATTRDAATKTQLWLFLLYGRNCELSGSVRCCGENVLRGAGGRIDSSLAPSKRRAGALCAVEWAFRLPSCGGMLDAIQLQARRRKTARWQGNAAQSRAWHHRSFHHGVHSIDGWCRLHSRLSRHVSRSLPSSSAPAVAVVGATCI